MQKKERMANLEVLRCVAMMMVVVLHYLGKGGLLPDLTAPLSVQDMVAWLLEAFCIVAVNVYMMISGYFLCESSFKLSRLLTLWLQLWLYSVGIGVLAVVCAVVSGILFAIIPYDKPLLLALMLQYTLPAPFIIPLYADMGDDAEYVSTTLSLGTVLAVVLFFFLAAFSLA